MRPQQLAQFARTCANEAASSFLLWTMSNWMLLNTISSISLKHLNRAFLYFLSNDELKWYNSAACLQAFFYLSIKQSFSWWHEIKFMDGLPLKCISVFGVQHTNDTSEPATDDTSEPATAKGCLSSYKLQIDIHFFWQWGLKNGMNMHLEVFSFSKKST